MNLSGKLWQKSFLVALVVLLLVVTLSRITVFEPLFSDLSEENQAAIVDYLRENSIPYRLDPSANAILVPGDRLQEVQAALAEAGLPGRELTESERLMAYISTAEEELRGAIEEMDGVASARVRIVAPGLEQPAGNREIMRAYVLLRLMPDETLTDGRAESMTLLVSQRMEELESDNVAVVEVERNYWARMLPDGQQADTPLQWQIERQLEKELVNRLRAGLENDFGAALVEVRTEICPDSMNMEFLPNPEAGQELTISMDISHMAAYAVVNREGLTEAQFRDIRSITAAAIGYDASRGDSITITAIEFE